MKNKKIRREDKCSWVSTVTFSLQILQNLILNPSETQKNQTFDSRSIKKLLYYTRENLENTSQIGERKSKQFLVCVCVYGSKRNYGRNVITTPSIWPGPSKTSHTRTYVAAQGRLIAATNLLQSNV